MKTNIIWAVIFVVGMFICYTMSHKNYKQGLLDGSTIGAECMSQSLSDITNRLDPDQVAENITNCVITKIVTKE